MCSSIEGIYVSVGGGTSVRFGVAVLKASASRSVKFGVVVFKACMLNWGDRSASTSTTFGVAVLKASMLEWGVDLPNLV